MADMNFSDILELLDNSDLTKYAELVIPSSNSSAKLKELSAKQQKQLICSLLDSEGKGKTEMDRALLSLLKENLELKSGSVEDLTLFDRSVLILHLRHLISDKIKCKFDSGIEEFSLSVLLDNLKDSYKHPTTISLAYDSLEAEVAPPTIATELRYLDSVYLKVDTNNKKDAKKLLSEVYLIEISKYISSIKVEGKEVLLSSLTPYQRIQVAEKLPIGILQLVVEQISVWKNDLEKYLTVKDVDSVSKVLDVSEMLLFITE